MTDRPVAVINADELLEWLKIELERVENNRDEALIEKYRSFYVGRVAAVAEVIDYVEDMKYLVDKPAEREEE